MGDQWYFWKLAEAMPEKIAGANLAAATTSFGILVDNLRLANFRLSRSIRSRARVGVDASSKEPVYLTVKFQPELTRCKKGSGKVVASPAITTTQQKIWTSSNFRLEISGLDCTKVKRVDSFTVTQKVASEDVSESRDYLKKPGKSIFRI